jgi:hypothetical protein
MLINTDPSNVEARIKELLQEAAQLKRTLRQRRGKTAQRERRPRTPTSVLAPGHRLTTIPGSLYDTALRVMADCGKLVLHQHLFGQLQKEGTPAAARKLLDEIGVPRSELERGVFDNALFREHQQRRTMLLKNRVAKGDVHAAAILRDPAIGDGHGNWRGDIEEAIAILYGGSRPAQLQRGKNVGILRRANLMFTRARRGEDTVLFLYPRRYHRLFLRARTLAGE